MILFTSDRERRLWIWTLVVVVGIYATLGLAARLAGLLQNQGLAAAAFFAAMLLVAATVLVVGLRARPSGVEIGVGLGIAVVYFMVLFRMTIPERTHLIEYGVLAAFIREALAERASQGRHVPVPGLLTILAASLIGVVDEGIQLVLPSRVFDPLDIVFNVLASVMTVVAMAVLGWVRRRFSRRKN